MRQSLHPDDWSTERGDIFALYSELGLSDEHDRHRLQHAITGCKSLRYMTIEEHRLLIRVLEQLVDKPYAERLLIWNGLLALSSFDYSDDESPF